MKISVAIATYNGELYVEKQLESILEQTRKVDEVIICDDRSSDGTVERVKNFIVNNGLEDKWSIIINHENVGYASNFMNAAKRTSGDLIFFCDQDDIWISNRVEVMSRIMEKNEDILVLGSEFEPFTTTEDAPSVPKWEMKKMFNDNSLERLSWGAGNIFIGCQGCTMCVRKEFFDMITDYWFEGWAHDEYVWKLALCKNGLFMYHGNTLKRRLHSTNVTMHKMRDVHKRVKFLEDLLQSHIYTLKFAKDNNLDSKKLRLLERNIKATRLRIALFKEKKYFNTIILLLLYSDCYHKRRAIPVELYMALINKEILVSGESDEG